MGSPALAIPAKEFEFTGAEITRNSAALQTWDAYGVGADRRKPGLQIRAHRSPRGEEIHLDVSSPVEWTPPLARTVSAPRWALCGVVNSGASAVFRCQGQWRSGGISTRAPSSSLPSARRRRRSGRSSAQRAVRGEPPVLPAAA